jgi:hypothetical protein
VNRALVHRAVTLLGGLNITGRVLETLLDVPTREVETDARLAGALVAGPTPAGII